MKLKFNLTYFVLTILLFLTEVAIALFIHDKWIRPFFGDFLVVILLYCAVKSICSISVYRAAAFVLIFSYVIEISQYFNYVEVFGLQDQPLARVVMGTYFSWIDLAMYTLGLIFIVIVENLIARRKNVNEH